MAKVIKEIILMLLVCLVVMLLFAVLFYKYIPSRKVVTSTTAYVASQEVQELLADSIDQEKEEVVTHYEITSRDLTNYEILDEYVPGKANPFAAVPDNVEKPNDENQNPGGSSESSSGGSSTSSNNSVNENNMYVRPSGLK